MSFIVINGQTHMTDTLEQIEAVQKTMRAAGVKRAGTFVGDPEHPATWLQNGRVLFADDCEVAS